jgi:DNA-binding Lrp family transcriptional regulator
MINTPERQDAVDDLDRQLIALLRDDARAAIASLAKKLQVARGTVQNRIAKLEEDGTIVGYTVRLKPQAEAQQIRAVMTIAVEGNRTQSVLRSLRGEPAVVGLHSTNGRWDFVAELRVDNLQEFDRLIARISLIEGVSRSETNLLLTSYKV